MDNLFCKLVIHSWKWGKANCHIRKTLNIFWELANLIVYFEFTQLFFFYSVVLLSIYNNNKYLCYKK